MGKSMDPNFIAPDFLSSIEAPLLLISREWPFNPGQQGGAAVESPRPMGIDHNLRPKKQST